MSPMNAFEYASPTSVADALTMLAGPTPGGAEALSGGTDLLCRMKEYVTSPARVVYLKEVKALGGITGDPKAGDGLTVGAGTLLAEVLAHQGLKEAYPALWQATLEVGTPQIRNMATVGGNLLQRPRCWYYRAGHGLLAMKDGKSLVRAGDNRYHAIYMTDGDALFVSPSSLATPLIALDARATVLGPKGERTVPVTDLYVVPKQETDRELTVQPGELLLKVTIPAVSAANKNASYEARQKRAHDWPLVLASVSLEMDGGKVGKARVMVYGVAPVPYRSGEAEAALLGKPLTAETAEAAGKAAAAGSKPLSMNAYKVTLTRTVIKRALMAAAGDRYWEEG